MRDWLARMRAQRQLSQKQLASGLQMNQSSYSRIESGSTSPGDLMNFLRKLSAIVNIPVPQLFAMELDYRTHTESAQSE